jgi:16S rRNA (guanine527-N7)-methyltransferase
VSISKPKGPLPIRSTPGTEPKSDNALWRLPEWFPQLPESILDQLKIYHGELLKFNLKLNLISRNTERESDETHFADSLFATDAVLKKDIAGPIHDIGSGNGLPGLVMALRAPDREFFLVESDSRKCEFVKHMIHVLKLQNVTVMNMRLESLKAEEIKNGISRGFASISKTLLLLNRSFPKGGKFFHLKGANWSSEIAEIPSQLISVWSPELVDEYSLPATQARRAVVCTTKSS